MGSYDKEERFSRRIGTGGRREDMEVVTHGRARLRVKATEPVVEMEPVSADPDAPRGTLGKGGFFFRDRGDGKAQFCVRFPSGAIQIISTEP